MDTTANYGFKQWEKTDRIQMEDFNADNAKTEQALAGLAAGQSELAAEVAKCGNCRMVYQSYRGTGTSGEADPTTLTFDAPPRLVIVMGYDAVAVMIRPYTSTFFDNKGSYNAVVNWNGNTVSYYSTNSDRYQGNSQTTYHVVAFIEADA